MKRVFFVLGTAVVILAWISESRVQAEAIQWDASGSPVGPGVAPNGTMNIYSLNNANSWVTFGAGLSTNGTNSGSVVLAYLGTADLSSDVFTPKELGGPSANYSLGLELHDLASGASGSLSFRGKLSGYFDGVASQINNTFIGPTTQSLTLGKDLYSVTIGPFVPPSAANDPNGFGHGGTISASISVQPATSSTPEPSSLLLACLGLPSLGLVRWLRRRREVVSSHASNV